MAPTEHDEAQADAPAPYVASALPNYDAADMQKAASDLKKALNEAQAAVSKKDTELLASAFAEMSASIDAINALASKSGGKPVPGTSPSATHDDSRPHPTTTTGGPKGGSHR